MAQKIINEPGRTLAEFLVHPRAFEEPISEGSVSLRTPLAKYRPKEEE